MTNNNGRRGSVKQDASGRWMFAVDIGSGADRRQTRRRGFATKKTAQAALTDTLSQLADHSYIAPSRDTLREFVESTWLPEVKSQLRPSTFASYSRYLRLHVLPVLGDTKLQAITGAMLTRLYNDLRASGMKDKGKLGPDGEARGLSVRTVRYIHTIIGATLQTAVEHDYLVKNPAKLAKPPKPSAAADGSATMHTWTDVQLGAFLSAERDDRLYPLWLLLATTAMRRGEALGAGWQHLDLDKAQLAIRRTLVDVLDTEGDAPVWSDPKTAKGRRTIALDAGTVAVLRAQRAAQAKERLRVGAGYLGHDLVFAMPDGRPYHPERLSRTFQARAKKHGLPKIRLHDLRHTWATLALEAGVHPKVVQERLGHANISITLDIYSHVSPAMQADAADRVAALIAGASS